MRIFLRDIRSGQHPLNRQELSAYCRWAEEHVHTWYPNTVHRSRMPARRFHSLFPSPRGTSADFDRWCNVADLRRGLAAALQDLTQP